jgi:hypothetical protein
MSDTPRTDLVSQRCEIYGYSRQYDEIKEHARQLERELNEAREQLSAMYHQHRCGCGHTACRRCRDDRDCERVLGIGNKEAK